MASPPGPPADPRCPRRRRATPALLAVVAAVAAAGLSPRAHADGMRTPSARSLTVAQNTPGASADAATAPTAAIAAARLRELVPAQIGAWKRSSLTSPAQRRRGAAEEGASALARFRHGRIEATLTISDLAGLSGAAQPAQWRGEPVERDTDDGREKLYQEAGHTVREWAARSGARREVSLILANGIVIAAAAEQAEMAALKQLADGIDLQRAAALRP